jgi:hypothetical protein
VHLRNSDLLNRFELSKRRGIIQIDIIAKIMMYVEDFIIILEANRRFDGNYYLMLDEKKPDLGGRVTEFLGSMDTLGTEDYRKMLCYGKPGSFGLDDFKTLTLRKLIDWNTKELKEFLEQIRRFRNTHAQIFRRYKHAGLPIRTGLLSLGGRYPYTSKLFDSDAMVFAGEQPMNNVIILPYSEDVIRGYRYLVNGVQNFISEAVENKIISIERKIDGNIPLYNYSRNFLSDREHNALQEAYEILNKRYPAWRKETEIRIHKTNPTPSMLEWYVVLDTFLDLCKTKTKIYGN